MEWNPVVVTVGEQEFRDEFSARKVRGNLERLDLGRWSVSFHRGLDHGDYVRDGSAGGRVDVSTAQCISQRLHDLDVACGKQGSVCPVEFGDQIHDLLDGVVGSRLDLEIETCRWKCFEGFLETRYLDALAAERARVSEFGCAALFDRAVVAGIELLEFATGHGVDSAFAIRGTPHV